MAVNLTPLVPVKKYGLASYKQMLINLLPVGHIWRNISTNFKLLFEAFAVELDRFEQRVTDLKREAIPGLSVEMLPEWEALALLPEERPLSGDSISQRQAVVHAKVTEELRARTAQFFIDYALAAYGMTITIAAAASLTPFRSGVNVSGDHLEADAAVYTWVITVVADPLSNISRMITAFRRMKLAHTSFIVNGIEYII
jgi:uncharacterized protein YmfQ (DUF2313 family)